jgi:hypothetical protein
MWSGQMKRRVLWPAFVHLIGSLVILLFVTFVLRPLLFPANFTLYSQQRRFPVSTSWSGQWEIAYARSPWSESLIAWNDAWAQDVNAWIGNSGSIPNYDRQTFDVEGGHVPSMVSDPVLGNYLSDELFGDEASRPVQVSLTRHGWPFRSFISGARIDPTGRPHKISRVTAYFPFIVVWWPFVLNLGFFVVAVLAIQYLLRGARRLDRRFRGRCCRCGYNLKYDLTQGCSECGWRRDGLLR